MITFLFWNINNNPLHDNIVRLVQKHHVDVVMLAEYDNNIPEGNLLYLLNQDHPIAYHYLPHKICKRIWIFARFSESMMQLIDEKPHFTIRHLMLPGLPSILMVISHLPSKRYRDANSQVSDSVEFAQTIRQIERQVGHERTILVGDLNMNPFEAGMTGVKNLNATMSQRKALAGKRQSDGQPYPYFYNPMWNLFGDLTSGPPGTYYYNGSFDCWHIFDQVILRPSLLELEYFDARSVRILETDGELSLLTKHRLPNKNLSDHLPIIFSLDL